MKKKQKTIFSRKDLRKTIKPASLSIIEERELELDVVEDTPPLAIITKSVSCRLTEDVVEDLDDIAKTLKLTRAGLITRILNKTSLEMIPYLATKEGG